jgi:hypothetical protein
MHFHLQLMFCVPNSKFHTYSTALCHSPSSNSTSHHPCVLFFPLHGLPTGLPIQNISLFLYRSILRFIDLTMDGTISRGMPSSSHILAHFPSPAINITTNLVSRSVVGHKLGIHIHQHYGHRQHLDWRGTGREQEADLERKFFRSPDLEDLCTQLLHAIPEGVCVFDAYTPVAMGMELCTKRQPHLYERTKPR